MTLRDRETLETLSDEPELLALADAVAATQRLPRRERLRRLAPRALTAAGLAAAVAVGLVLALSGGGGSGIVDRALAAIGNGRVLHLVTRVPTGTVLVDLKTGRRTTQMLTEEVWFDRSTHRLHLLWRVNGRVADLVVPIAKVEGRADPAFTALLTGYREALASGEATLERRGVVGGRPVYWLRFPPARSGLHGTEVAIDRTSYKPVVFREHYSPTAHLDERVLVAETTGFRPSVFRRRGPSIFAGTSSGGLAVSSPPRGRPTIRRPWLTPGPVRLRLRSVGPVTVRARGRTFHGVVLLYGTQDLDPERAPLSIQELTRPDDPSLWRSIPRGSISIQRSDVSDAKGTHARWIGYVVKRGIYVTIQSGRGERDVVALAKSLRPAR